MSVVISERAWEETRRRLRAFVSHRIDDTSLVDDLVQEILLRIHLNVGSLADEERLDAWVFQIARNAIADHHRKRARTPVTSQPVEVEQIPEIDRNATSDEARAQIARCLVPMVDELPSEYREALRLVEVEGLTQRAAAARVGISTSGMKSRVQRARRQLKGVLLECCDVTVDSRGSVTDFTDRGGRCYSCDDAEPI